MKKKLMLYCIIISHIFHRDLIIILHENPHCTFYAPSAKCLCIIYAYDISRESCVYCKSHIIIFLSSFLLLYNKLIK